MSKDRTRHARKGQPIPAPYTEGAPGTKRPRAGEADLPAEQEAAEAANEGEPLSGSGRDASGSLPGSVGGTTGTAGENAGVRSPGAAVPDFPGISPGEAERLRRTRH